MRRLWSFAFGGLIALALIACAGRAAAPTPTLRAVISQADAIARGLDYSRSGFPELSGALEGPFNPHAELMTLAEAYVRLDISPSNAQGDSARQPVWLVTLDGTWRSEAQAPGAPDSASQSAPLLHHYLLIVDATSGEVTTTTVRP